jgi:hypothetical protein
MKTNVLVRVQARGGKFLGPDIGYSGVTVRDVESGRILARGVATGGSGDQPTTSFSPGTSRDVILAPGNVVYWLSPVTTPPTAGFLATVDLERPTLVEISACGLTNGLSNEHTVSVQTWLVPGADLTEEPGVVLIMPGLNVQILAPTIPSPPAAPSFTVTAWVTMMCGCKISNASGSLWQPSEFAVNATLSDVGGGIICDKPMTLSATPSMYTAEMQLPSNGEYKLVVTAVQASEGNVGAAEGYFGFTAS